MGDNVGAYFDAHGGGFPWPEPKPVVARPVMGREEEDAIKAIPTPAMLRKQIEAKDRAAIEQLQAKVHGELVASWRAGSPVHVDVAMVPQRVVDAVIHRLGARGWKAKYHSGGQREGATLEVDEAAGENPGER